MSKIGPYCLALRLMAGLGIPINPCMGALSQNQSPVGGIDYDALEKERAARMQHELQKRLRDEFHGRQDGLRQIILRSITMGDYKRAEEDLVQYINLKGNYPDFAPRVEQLVQHAKELINAIRSKRNLPGLGQLTMSKQKEIMDHVVAHFNELKSTLKAIERIASDVALSDIRSTVWLLKTCSYVVLSLVVAVFLRSFNTEIGQPFWIVFNDLVNLLFDRVVGLI
jgi:hypothetical protein